MKIVTLGDHPLINTGVAIQTKNMIESLLELDDSYEFISLAGNYKNGEPVVTEKWGERWKIFPVGKDNPEFAYGTPEVIRSVLRTEKPDIFWFMSDPHNYRWLFQLEDEIRPLMPMVYYHVWDNYPVPNFNKNYYDSVDHIATISKLTDEVVGEITDTPKTYIPHAIDTSVFKPLESDMIQDFKVQTLGEDNKDCFMFFWNNKNCHRKMGANLLWMFKDFVTKRNLTAKDVCLVMHTNPEEAKGCNLTQIIYDSGLEGQVLISNGVYDDERLAMMYNVADCTINISQAEGFGLSTAESLACETPIIITATGGLQDQFWNGPGSVTGIRLQPSSTSVVSSQLVPYIYEDRINQLEFEAALEEMMKMSDSKRKKLGKNGRELVLEKFNLENWKQEGKAWDGLFKTLNKEFGSWDNRRGYNNWEITAL
jgi:glycosyltransferase involved in cell wall biosynthesis